MEKGIAFFDLDGTITSRDTFIDFIIFCRSFTFFISGLFILSPFIILYFFKLYPNDKLKECFFKFYLSKFSAAHLEKLGKYYSINKLPEIIYKDALDRIEWHKKSNHRVIILTASSPIWLSEWCSLNELDLIGTEFEKLGDKYTGKIKGKNCHGLQKMVIVDKILNETEFNLTYGYGDSKGDKLFLYKLKNIYYKPKWIKNHFR